MARRMLDSIKEVDELDLKQIEEYKIAQKRAEMNVNDMYKLLNNISESTNSDDILTIVKGNNLIEKFNYLNTLSYQTTKVSELINNYNEIAANCYELIDKMREKERQTQFNKELLENIKLGHSDKTGETIDKYSSSNYDRQFEVNNSELNNTFKTSLKAEPDSLEIQKSLYSMGTNDISMEEIDRLLNENSLSDGISNLSYDEATAESERLRAELDKLFAEDDFNHKKR